MDLATLLPLALRAIRWRTCGGRSKLRAQVVANCSYGGVEELAQWACAWIEALAPKGGTAEV
jgi:hypothetical protein